MREKNKMTKKIHISKILEGGYTILIVGSIKEKKKFEEKIKNYLKENMPEKMIYFEAIECKRLYIHKDLITYSTNNKNYYPHYPVFKSSDIKFKSLKDLLNQ